MAKTFRSVFKTTSVINWFPGHMNMAKNSMKAQLGNIDVIIEVRDARIPFTSANPLLDGIGNHKPRLVVLNKSDLANSNMKARVEARFDHENIDSMFTSVIKGKHIQKILQWCTAAGKSQFQSTAGTVVMIVGIPNVGKSSMINAFRSLSSSLKVSKGKKKAVVGATPGVTVRTDMFKVNESPAIYVMDTPGVMLPNIPTPEVGLKLALTGAIKDDIVGVELLADYMLFILNRMNSKTYVKALGLPEATDDIEEVFEAVARQSGGVGKPEEIQRILAASYLLKEFRRGAFGTFTLDPV
ncbi:GTPase [Thraustotheca clavata]|uniref:Mitochondrial GTPase 1 n=1 Tax=Thraustotheca clavata TaxID=74557 RepID=A0A1V9Y456_9STRA|nr:GTPase [Thraustotheca clavata]